MRGHGLGDSLCSQWLPEASKEGPAARAPRALHSAAAPNGTSSSARPHLPWQRKAEKGREGVPGRGLLGCLPLEGKSEPPGRKGVESAGSSHLPAPVTVQVSNTPSPPAGAAPGSDPGVHEGAPLAQR